MVKLSSGMKSFSNKALILPHSEQSRQMARFLPKSMRWSLEVSRSTKRLSINFHATIPRHRFSTTHTFTKPLSPKSSRSRQTQRFSFSSGSKYFWPEAELPRQTRSVSDQFFSRSMWFTILTFSPRTQRHQKDWPILPKASMMRLLYKIHSSSITGQRRFMDSPLSHLPKK